DSKDTEAMLSILGFLDGQTTNPSLIAKSPGAIERLEHGEKFSQEELLGFYKETVQKISALVPQGSVSIEVYADHATLEEDMFKQGKDMFSWIPNAHIKYQTTKDSISELLQGFQRTKDKDGYEILTVLGWDYEGLCKTYRKAEKICRKEHVPVLIHVQEMTQPQGHSTSGSHERKKSKERLQWEDDFDPIRKMREWILDNEYAGAEELDTIEQQAKDNAKQARVDAWNAFVNSMKGDQDEAVDLIGQLADESAEKEKILSVKNNLEKTLNPVRGDAIASVKKVLRIARHEDISAKQKLSAWCEKMKNENYDRFSSHLYSQSADAALNVQEVKAIYKDDSPVVDGREVLLACFDAALSRDPKVLAFGEDLGKIGDVNQGFAGLQEKYGELRVTDTGIRECTIIGQGIGLAMRGLRPIAEIQYLDYLLYALQIMSDDLATVQYRTKGGQKAPLIIRTRGHRLEGIWHSGSPIGTILHSCRGIYVLVPRNMTRAAGFYNTMLRSDDPALIIECLNGYRIKEKIPSNIGELTVPIGVPEVLKEGTDITIVTYGSMCRIVMEAADQLEETGISCEVIDVQTLLPFDIHHKIVESVKKTNRVIFADEDVPGGASAYMMQGVLEEQDAYYWLDSQPRTLSAMPHRPAYGSDGDYFSKPNIEDVFDLVYEMMHEAEPGRFPAIY
ncbi:MAG: hypothetical protein IIA88_01680, partial [Bacteroidetes bacterium]|nr:hypothetical protein [Bacteroidota bacterium]